MSDQLLSRTHAYQIENTYGYYKYTLINKYKEVLIERYMVDTFGPDATALVVDFFKRYGL